MASLDDHAVIGDGHTQRLARGGGDVERFHTAVHQTFSDSVSQAETEVQPCAVHLLVHRSRIRSLKPFRPGDSLNLRA